MKERGILFSDAMVRAILEGRKNQTRRVIKPQPIPTVIPDERTPWWAVKGQGREFTVKCPYGVPGDRLIVRETWRRWDNGGRQIAYRADLRCYEACTNESDIWSVFDDGFSLTKDPGGWNPSSHMPRWASRITLEITDVRVQRLQEISEEDAWAEGIAKTGFTPEEFARNQAGDRNVLIASFQEDDFSHNFPSAKEAFARLWDSINGKTHPWSANDWVWAITFAVTERSAGRGKL